MTSEIRTNSITSRAGMSTVTMTDSGPMFSGITTFVDNSTFSVGTGGTIHAPATNVMALGTNSIDAIKIDSSGNVNVTGILTASSISGGVSLASGADNRVVTATGANAIEGEANFTFNGNTATITASSGYALVANGASTGIGLGSNGAIVFGNQNVAAYATGVIDASELKFNISGSPRVNLKSSVLLIGNTSSQEVYGTNAVQIQGTTAGSSSMSLVRHGNSPYLTLGSSGGSSLGAVTALSSGNRIGQLTFVGADGTDINTHAASIAAYVDGSVSSNNVPARIVFATGPSETERLRITSEGYLKLVDNGGTYTNATQSYSAEGAFLTHYTARTTSGGDKYRRMFDIASVGANPWGSSIRFLTSADSTNPATTVERVRIDHNGRVGINKSTPQTMLSIKAERSATPRFGIDGHYSDSSYTQCTWDDSSGLYTLLGVNHKLDANGNDATPVSSLHSASMTLDGRYGRIYFRVKPDSGTSFTEVVRIYDNGYIGINNNNPDQRVKIGGNVEFNSYDNTNGSGGYYTAKGLIIGNAYDAGISGLTDDRNAIIWQERGLDLDIGTNNKLRLKIGYGGDMLFNNCTTTINSSNYGLYFLNDSDTTKSIFIKHSREANGTHLSLIHI